MRLQWWHLPSVPSLCDKTQCVYNTDGICDDPRNNKGNGDAKCHRESNKSVIARLKPAESEPKGQKCFDQGCIGCEECCTDDDELAAGGEGD